MIIPYAATKRFLATLCETEYELTDSDDVTLPGGNSTASNGPQQQMFRLIRNHASPEDLRTLPLQHSSIIQAMLTDFEGVKVYFNKGSTQPITSLTNIKKFAKDYHCYFDISNDTDNKKGISFLSVVFRVETDISLRAFRENSTISQVLKDNNLILRPHQWHEDEKQIMTIAYVAGIDGIKYQHEHVNAMITGTLENNHIPFSDIPRFQIVKRRATSNYKGKTKSRTMFAIEVRKKDRIQATRFFVKHLNQENSTSILPFWLKNVK
jgi:hypothetical protein